MSAVTLHDEGVGASIENGWGKRSRKKMKPPKRQTCSLAPEVIERLLAKARSY